MLFSNFCPANTKRLKPQSLWLVMTLFGFQYCTDSRALRLIGVTKQLHSWIVCRRLQLKTMFCYFAFQHLFKKLILNAKTMNKAICKYNMRICQYDAA